MKNQKIEIKESQKSEIEILKEEIERLKSENQILNQEKEIKDSYKSIKKKRIFREYRMNEIRNEKDEIILKLKDRIEFESNKSNFHYRGSIVRGSIISIIYDENVKKYFISILSDENIKLMKEFSKIRILEIYQEIEK